MRFYIVMLVFGRSTIEFSTVNTGSLGVLIIFVELFCAHAGNAKNTFVTLHDILAGLTGSRFHVFLELIEINIPIELGSFSSPKPKQNVETTVRFGHCQVRNFHP